MSREVSRCGMRAVSGWAALRPIRETTPLATGAVQHPLPVAAP
ncbi:hypothetical protein [Pseudonocardia yunnanensis]|uniref:Uncharacterized protein n=1 Tax=Pseudonocardia yunnanensis TaxID=58107 RepID=A0ABW4EMM0_9PSEU